MVKRYWIGGMLTPACTKELEALCLEREWTRSAKASLEEESLTLDFSGSPEEEKKLLETIVAHGFRVDRYRRRNEKSRLIASLIALGACAALELLCLLTAYLPLGIYAALKMGEGIVTVVAAGFGYSVFARGFARIFKRESNADTLTAFSVLAAGALGVWETVEAWRFATILDPILTEKATGGFVIACLLLASSAIGAFFSERNRLAALRLIAVDGSETDRGEREALRRIQKEENVSPLDHTFGVLAPAALLVALIVVAVWYLTERDLTQALLHGGMTLAVVSPCFSAFLPIAFSANARKERELGIFRKDPTRLKESASYNCVLFCERAKREIVACVQGAKCKAALLSSQDKRRTQIAAETAGIEDYMENVTPEGKRDFVCKLKTFSTVCVMGETDGDALALREADLGATTREATQQARLAAQLVLEREELLFVARERAERNGRLLRRTIFVAVLVHVLMAVVASGVCRSFGLIFAPRLYGVLFLCDLLAGFAAIVCFGK
ncbi:MAG: hypothetical protein ACI4U2_06715 [Christensenellaceae bacterium]